MANYKFLKRKNFEKIERFESRINEEAARGWRVVNFVQHGAGQLVLLEKER